MTDFPFPGLNLAVTTPFDSEGPDRPRPARGASRALHRRRGRRLRPELRHRHARLSLARGVRRARRARARRSSPAGPRSSCRPRRSWSRTWWRAPGTPPTAARTASWCCRRSSRGRPTTRACSPSTPPPPRAACRSSATTFPRPSASASRRRCSAELCRIPNFCTVKDSSGDLAQQTDLIRTGHPVMNGADPLMPYALFAGAGRADLGRRQLRAPDLRRPRQGRGASAAGTRRARSGGCWSRR